MRNAQMKLDSARGATGSSGMQQPRY